MAGDPRVVFLDTETTGLGADDEVIDIALVGSDGRVLLDALVRPSRPIPSMATAVHGLCDADVVAAPGWADVHPAVVELLADRTVVVYNAEFDRRLLVQTCGRRGLAVPEIDWQCAMRAYAEFRGEPGRRGFRWFQLEQAARTLGIAPGGHRALGDALACRDVVVAMASIWEVEPEARGGDLGPQW